jgi:hypothetical protein
MDLLNKAASSEVSPEMSNLSNSTGTFVCCSHPTRQRCYLDALDDGRTSKISSTAFVISFPTPSPGMSVTE